MKLFFIRHPGFNRDLSKVTFFWRLTKLIWCFSGGCGRVNVNNYWNLMGAEQQFGLFSIILQI